MMTRRKMFVSCAQGMALMMAGPSVWSCRSAMRKQNGDEGSTFATFSRAAVAADHAMASEAGAAILRRGGNAVDAAVATSLALSVVRPYSCGIGGGGFMVLRWKDGRQAALNYRERAPAVMDALYFERQGNDDASKYGGKAVGVPGTVAGLLHALSEHGTMDLATVAGPAITAAENGFIVDEHYVSSTRRLVRWFEDAAKRQNRYSFVWNRFLRKGQVAVGDRIRLPEQAAALRLIAGGGAKVFYEGEIAGAILAATRGAGGEMAANDLRTYRVDPVEPLSFDALGHTFLTMPPPSSGGLAIAQILGVLEICGIRGVEAGSVEYIHILAEAMKHAFADRARWLGDSAFVDVPVKELMSREYLESLAGRIDRSATRPAGDYGSIPPDDAGTSHFCVVDADGNAASVTETINLEFGSLVAVEEFGFVLNNEMDDFTSHPGRPNAFGLIQSGRNSPAPGKRPLSSMTPTIVLDSDGNLQMLAGAAGGPRIITSTLQCMLNVLLRGDSAQAALARPRVHHQWMPGVLNAEKGALSVEQSDKLRTMGHRIGSSESIGNVQLIRRNQNGYQAACDPRKGGRPAGL